MPTDISNRFLSVEIIIPFIILAVGGLISYGSLSSDVEHKAGKLQVEVIQTQLDNIASDVSENKEAIDDTNDTVDRNHDILIRLETLLMSEDESR